MEIPCIMEMHSTFSFLRTGDLTLCFRRYRLVEKPGPTDTELKYCRTAGKPGGNQRKQTST